MHATEKRTTEYKTLSAQGVWCGELRANNYNQYKWTLHFKWAHHLTRAEAKELMTQFLKSQYEATELSFYGRQGEMFSGYVKFSTFCL
jgi:hypothetical protein